MWRCRLQERVTLDAATRSSQQYSGVAHPAGVLTQHSTSNGARRHSPRAPCARQRVQVHKLQFMSNTIDRRRMYGTFNFSLPQPQCQQSLCRKSSSSSSLSSVQNVIHITSYNATNNMSHPPSTQDHTSTWSQTSANQFTLHSPNTFNSSSDWQSNMMTIIITHSTPHPLQLYVFTHNTT